MASRTMRWAYVLESPEELSHSIRALVQARKDAFLQQGYKGAHALRSEETVFEVRWFLRAHVASGLRLLIVHGNGLVVRIRGSFRDL